MLNFETVISQAKAILEADETIIDTNTVTIGFYPRTLPNPLMNIYTVLKPLGLEITENEEEGSTYAKVVRYTLGVSLHKAERQNPSDLLSKFSAVLNAFENSEFTVENAGYNELKRDPDTNSIILPGYFTFKMYY